MVPVQGFEVYRPLSATRGHGRVRGVTTAHVTPWRPLSSCRRVDVEAWHSVRRAAETFLAVPQAGRALEALVGAKVAVALRTAKRAAAALPLEGGIALELAQGDEAVDVIVEVETALAVNLVARALKRPSPRLAGMVGDDEARALAGGVAAILAAVSRVENPGGPLQIRAAGPSSAVIAARGARGWIDSGTFDIAVDGESYLARVHVGHLKGSSRRRTFDRQELARLGSIPLEIPIVGMTSRATVADVAALEVGDAWMLGPAPPFLAGRNPGSGSVSLGGEVVLAAPDADAGARAILVEGGVLVLRAGREELSLNPMPDEQANDPLVEAVGDVPVVVRVEVGAARMSAREWAEVGEGDVIGLAHKLAEPVTLRVGGVEVAKGELVDLEGEIAVRILSRAGGAGRAP
jgi:flagellar motor switch/type III secretory pathway protein FliN